MLPVVITPSGRYGRVRRSPPAIHHIYYVRKCLAIFISLILYSLKKMSGKPPIKPNEPHFRLYGQFKRPNLGLKNDLLCALGEFLGTAMFLFLALGGSNFASNSSSKQPNCQSSST